MSILLSASRDREIELRPTQAVVCETNIITTTGGLSLLHNIHDTEGDDNHDAWMKQKSTTQLSVTNLKDRT